MKRTKLCFVVVWVLGAGVMGWPRPVVAEPPKGEATFEKSVTPFLTTHCIKCHGPEKQAGDVRLDTLTPGDPKSAAVWAQVRDQIRDGLMPPAKLPKPNAIDARAVVAWATATLGARPARLPNQGNLIPHELLFGTPAPAGDSASPARIWRISPAAYSSLLLRLAKDAPGVSQPFTLVDERGIRDFAGLYGADIPSTEILIRNAIAIVEAQTTAEYTVLVKPPKGSTEPAKPEQRKNQTAVQEFVKLVQPGVKPTAMQIESAVRTQFRMAIGRVPDAEDVARYLALYEKCLKDGDAPSAVKAVLQAVLLKSEVIFRNEMGGSNGRQLLPPSELARTISLTLGNRLDNALLTAAEKGQLQTKEQAIAQIQRMLNDPKSDRSRIPHFFREYFEYHTADDVFKDKPMGVIYSPRTHINETDLLIAHVLKQDRDVFRQLLTTPLTFVNARGFEGKLVRSEAKMGGTDKKTGKFTLGIEGIYGFEKWPEAQPVEMPPDTRMGVLMQPSWLIAWSTNFDNDPVRRGRWVRERLLGGTVPDLPIGVTAQVPDDPDHTFRSRLEVTRAAECWKCHQKMDELGLPFEQFDHYGLLRKTERVEDLEATAKNVDSKGKPKGKVYREVPLNTSGVIVDSGDPKLEGPVNSPYEMIRKIANSDRARQVFVRHVFRYFLGRNESLADARTLQDADAAFVKSGGSFNALLTSLLTSDAFLYRTHQNTTPAGASK